MPHGVAKKKTQQKTKNKKQQHATMLSAQILQAVVRFLFTNTALVCAVFQEAGLRGL